VSPTAGLAAPIKYKHLNAWVLAQESVCAIKCEEVLDWARERERERQPAAQGDLGFSPF
jgi:hypothetical protein